VAERLRALGVRPGAHVLVALSGGADSVVLLHLLRFAVPGLRLTAAHFDHAMRPSSAADARWVRGLCRAWDVPLITRRADRLLRSEGEAREARYGFLRAAQAECGAGFLATAHHADDQAETVLFRMMRGSGLAGLAGIPERGPDGLIRPLLPWWRAELRAYARARHLRWRRDPTNRGLHPVRNRIRHRLIPLLERRSPGLRGRLVALAGAAGEAESLLDRAALRALHEVSREEEGGLLLERAALSAYHSPVATRVLRRALRRYGTVLDRPGTRTALEFIRSAPSGAALVLPGGRARILNEFGWARIAPVEPPPPPDLPLVVVGRAGAGEARIGGRTVRVRWRTDEAGTDEAALDPALGPLTVRGWMPGDRIRTAAGGRTLKKLFNDARVPRSRRARVPVVCDAAGRVVWVVGVARAADSPPPRGPALILSMVDA
jgi:tRNA(Ile)-lysidine synthase